VLVGQRENWREGELERQLETCVSESLEEWGNDAE
jgi:hypothetical protein